MKGYNLPCIKLRRWFYVVTSATRWLNCLKNGPSPDSFCLFFVFSNITIFVTKNYSSSMQCRDSNSQPFELDSPPITTRPGLPPMNSCNLPWIKLRRWFYVVTNVTRWLDCSFSIGPFTTINICHIVKNAKSG